MGYTLPLFLGFLAASAGITPPGLINMTAAKVGMNEGRARALIFALGATAVVVVQTFIAVVFARFLDKNPDVIILLREVGLAIFTALTIYFFWLGNKVKPKKRDFGSTVKEAGFFGDAALGTQFFPIPFYVFVSITLSSYNYFYFNKPFVYSFVIGSGIGAFFAFYCYIAFFKRLESQTAFLLRNMNFIIGSVTGLVAVVTLCNIIQYYW